MKFNRTIPMLTKRDLLQSGALAAVAAARPARVIYPICLVTEGFVAPDAGQFATNLTLVRRLT